MAWNDIAVNVQLKGVNTLASKAISEPLASSWLAGVEEVFGSTRAIREPPSNLLCQICEPRHIPKRFQRPPIPVHPLATDKRSIMVRNGSAPFLWFAVGSS
ncbi:hypothetical protein AVEN_54157-1 [Araneus ventricosus]|uniref:Uncharacterized protein n=1 Tax=Araneus ventricosus TaxID=182803 RepID=A0A4Y2BTK6_ARAVE|nr:hypothetical protein AVEN_54157-1 [Araneus ventricosus]